MDENNNTNQENTNEASSNAVTQQSGDAVTQQSVPSGTQETQKTFEDNFNEDDKVESNLNIWKYEEEPQVIGVVIEKKPGIYGEQVSLRTNEVDELILPSLSALNTQLANANINDKVKIVYNGEKKSQKTGRMYKDFAVYIKKEENSQ
ncbi:MAG: hypothetical protein ACOC1P_02860 [Minisyncoccales bacterium]